MAMNTAICTTVQVNTTQVIFPVNQPSFSFRRFPLFLGAASLTNGSSCSCGNIGATDACESCFGRLAPMGIQSSSSLLSSCLELEAP